MKPLRLLITLTIAASGLVEAQRLQFENGRISAEVTNSGVSSLLEALASHAKLNIFVAEEIGEDTISLEMKGVPLEDALHTILAAYDYFFYYQAGDGGKRALRSVWVYPKGAAASLRPVPEKVWAGSKELEMSLSDSDPAVRAKAYEALADRPNARSRELLLQALMGRERDEGLRQRILSTAISRGSAISPSVLAELARADSSENIRWMALDGLSQLEFVREVAQGLQSDPSESVRQRAGEILAEWQAADRRRERPAINREPDRN